MPEASTLYPLALPPPFLFLSRAALAAGWYLGWRTLPHTIGVMVAAEVVAHWAARPERSVWCPITWRNFEANSLAVVLGHAVHEAVDPWLVTRPQWLAFVVTLGLAIATIVTMLTVWGWIAGRVLGRTPPFDDPLRVAALSRQSRANQSGPIQSP